jgi:uncharacterized protein
MQEIVLLIAGMAMGVMNAVAGGGTLLGFPVLIAAGVSPIVANVTSHLVVMPGAFSATYGYRKQLFKLRRSYLILTIPCAIGAAIGAIILRNTPPDRFQQLVPGLVLFAVILFAFQPLLHFHLHRHMRSRSKALGPLLLISLAMLPVAIYGGYFGAGFGFIMLAFLGFTRLHEIHQMNALKNLGGIIISVVSIIFLLDANLIDWNKGLIMAAGCLVGGYFGAKWAQKISSHIIRIIVIVIGLTTAIYIGIDSYNL